MRKISVLIFLMLLSFGSVFSQITTGMAATGVIGQADFTSGGSGTSATTLKGPNGVAVDPTSGKLFVVDRSNNRVLRYASVTSISTGAAAEAVFGQTDFTSAGSGTAANKFNAPIGIAFDNAGSMWIGDYGNNRVLRFDNASNAASGANANAVIGQASFTSGSASTSQSGLNGPVGVAVDKNGTLWVSQFGSHRVTWYLNAKTKADGANADGVLGQANFSDATSAVGANRMSFPNAVYVDADGNMYVSDYGNKRVLRFNAAASKANGADADAVFGQADFNANGAGLSQNAFNSTRFVWGDTAGRLYVVEEANNRMMIFNNAKTLGNGANADYVIGQPDFTSGSANTTNTGYRTPRAVYIHETATVSQIWLADYNNNRVLWYDLTPPDLAEVKLTKPAGSETLFIGDQTQITWTSKEVATVKLEASYDNKGTWETIASGLTASTGTYTWTVPNHTTTTAFVRITDEAKPDKHLSINATAFSIAAKPPKLTVLTPNGGESFRIGSTMNITWGGANVDSVKVEVSYNGKNDWTTLAPKVLASTGKFDWKVTENVTQTGFIRVSDVKNATVSDESDAAFSIQFPPYDVKLMSPNGYQNWQVGSKKQILFSAKEAQNLSVLYSTDAGANWKPIADVAGTATSVTWTVPDAISSQCLVRVQVKEASQFSATSVAPFSIIAPVTSNPQEFVLYSDVATTGYWDASWGYANAPSTLDLVNGSKFPISSDYGYYGNYSLKMNWKSGVGGDWALAAAGDGWVGWDLTTKDYLEFKFMAPSEIAPEKMPYIFMEDLSNAKSEKIKFTDYIQTSTVPGWKQVKIPMTAFTSKPGLANFMRIKTIFWAQNQADAEQHTLYIDDLRATGGKVIDYGALRVVVVLGSSTAAGTGASPADSSWVNRFRVKVLQNDPKAQVINLAVGGYTTYDVMPSDFTPIAGRPAPKVNNNITKALSYQPDVLIVNLPSNDASNGYPLSEQIANYKLIRSMAQARNLPLFVSTTQPRNFSEAAKRQALMDMRDSTYVLFSGHTVDFWTGIANSDGTIVSKYNSGDGIHLNNAGHRLLYQRMVGFSSLWLSIFPTAIDDEDPLPSEFGIEQNHPNPFHTQTRVSYRLPAYGEVMFEVYNLLGQRVQTDREVKTTAGVYEYTFDGHNLPSGMYLLKVSTKDGQSRTIKMMLVK